MSTLFPVLFEPITLVFHCMKIIERLVDFLNRGLVRIIAGGQPVYALRKKVQQMYPSHYNDIVWMMGPLHIEMAFHSAIGDWLEVCDQTELLEKAKINTLSQAESLLARGKVERSRSAHQITLVAFKSQSEITVYEEWEDHLKKSFANAKYCVLVIELESLLFMFVKSLRLADFSLFVLCLKEMIISVSFRSYTS